MAKVLKPFSFRGVVVHPGDRIDPTPEHHKQLARNGMVDEPKPPRPGKAKAPGQRATKSPGVTVAGIERRTKLVGD